MRFNERELKYAGKQLPADYEGRLSYKQPRDSYKERLFKLRGNLLYYTRISDAGQPESEVLGVIVLEKFTVKNEESADQPFVFSIVFEDERDKKHLFSCSSLQQRNLWVEAIGKQSYHSIKEEFWFLKDRLRNLKKNDTASSLLHNSLKLPSTPGFKPMTPPVPRRSAPPPPLPARPSTTLLSQPAAVNNEPVPTGLLIDL